MKRHKQSEAIQWLSVALIFAMTLARSVVAGEATNLASNRPACCLKEIAACAPLPDRSLYQLDSLWTNDSGAGLRLTSLRGRPQIVTMFFANCGYACPLLVNDMKRIEAALPASARTNVGFVLVSFDPDRDTSAVLAEYRKNHHLGANWTLLRGTPDDVLELGALLGVKFKKDAVGQFAHSNTITILDSDGQIAHQQHGLNRDPAPTLAALDKCLKPKR
jgi:protein SCO1